MKTLESRLRDALTERAARSPITPDAWERTVARNRRLWWRPWRAGLLAPLAAAAAVIAIVIGVTSVVSPAPADRPADRSSMSPSPAPTGTPCDVQHVRMECTSAIVAVRAGSGHQATVTDFAFGYGVTLVSHTVGHLLLFCGLARYQTPAPGPGGGGGCTRGSLPPGVLASSANSVLDIQYGLAAQQVRSVTAVLTNGRRVPGVVASGRGFPLRAWQVRYPVQYPATLLFYDAAGHQVSKLFIAAYDQDFKVPPSGGIGLFPTSSGTMTAYLVKGMITFWASDSWEGGFPAADWPAVTGLLGSASYWARNECFGYVHAGVARVVVRLDSGYQTTISTFTPGWPRSGVRFFAIALPPSLFPALSGSAAQGTVTAYDETGRVMAREPLISV